MESMGGGYVIDPYATKHKRKSEIVINYLNKLNLLFSEPNIKNKRISKFSKLNKDLTYFPVVEMGLCGSKIQIFNDLDFPEEK